VVSGLAALIRARFPALTARQVMQRIESTAHHPPAGWDPVVGNGTIDALAAVSTDAGPPANTSKPAPAPLPITTPPSASSNSRGRSAALRGAAVCVVALVGVLATGAAMGRLRGTRNRVPGD
jgi:membrane-anchored mycosin MYCP